jgi:hypothetical protein
MNTVGYPVQYKKEKFEFLDDAVTGKSDLDFSEDLSQNRFLESFIDLHNEVLY